MKPVDLSKISSYSGFSENSSSDEKLRNLSGRFKIQNFTRVSSASPPSTNIRSSIVNFTRKLSKSPNIHRNTFIDIKKGSNDEFSNEYFSKKRQKNIDALANQQLKVFQKEFTIRSYKQKDFELFNKTNGVSFKNFLDLLKKKNEKKGDALKGL